MGLDRGPRPGTPGIAQRSWPGLLPRCKHHVRQLILILGNHVDDVGNATQIADIEEAVMGWAIIARKSTTIHAEDDGQVLQTNIMHDGVEGSLQESGVDGTDGTEAHGGKASGKDDTMFLGDTYIEISTRMMRAEKVECGSIGHGRSDGHYLGVLIRQFDQRIGKHFGVGTLPRWCGLTRIRVVGAEAVKFLLLVERRLETASLLGNGVKQDRALLGLQELKCFDQQPDVVAI